MKNQFFTQQEIEHIKDIKRKNNNFMIKNLLAQITKGLVVSAIIVLAIELIK